MALLTQSPPRILGAIGGSYDDESTYCIAGRGVAADNGGCFVARVEHVEHGDAPLVGNPRQKKRSNNNSKWTLETRRNLRLMPCLREQRQHGSKNGRFMGFCWGAEHLSDEWRGAHRRSADATLLTLGGAR